MILEAVLRSYRAALGRWLPLVASHLFIRLVITSLMVPVIGLLLAITLLFSDQTALTDQDIAGFLLTPAGAVGAVIILSMVLVALVLDTVVATAILRGRSRRPLEALSLAAGFTLHAVPRLLPFLSMLIGRLLVMSLPFLLVGGGIAYFFLTEHDINYYLVEKPTDFVVAAGLIGAVLLLLALLLLTRVSAWAIGLHLVMFHAVPAHRAFGISEKQMAGHRLPLVARLAAWAAVRMGLSAIAGACAASALTRIADWDTDNLRMLVAVMVVFSLFYAAIIALVNAISNGALADMLNNEFDRALSGAAPANDIAARTAASETGFRERLVIGVIAALSLVGLGTGELLATLVAEDAEVEIIAHRGAAARAPENTMASVRRALEDGADWIEIDVQESADGDIIVVHDSDFMKSSGVATKVWNVTADELAKIDVGSTFGSEFSAERVPLLQDVLEAARGRAGVIIELKYYGHDQDLENRVVRIVEQARMAERISTMSLKYGAVRKMKALRPEWRAGVLAATSVGNLGGLEGDFLALNQSRINASVTRRAEDAGKAVYAWTVNDPLTIARMLWIGVDGLITDDPAMAREVVNGYNSLSVSTRFLLAVAERVRVTIEPEAFENLRP